MWEKCFRILPPKFIVQQQFSVFLGSQVQKSYLIQSCVNVLLKYAFFLCLALCHIVALRFDANIHLTIFPGNLFYIYFYATPLHISCTPIIFCLDC